MDYSHYIPGVCNIGQAEIARRKRIGWAGLILAIVFLVLFAQFDAGKVWLLLIFLSSAASASGFIQGKMHFCAAFGLMNVFNFGSDAGTTDTVIQAEFRAQDKKKALQILGYSTLVGLVVTLAAFLLKQGVQ
jgi:hypothetical protein